MASFLTSSEVFFLFSIGIIALSILSISSLLFKKTNKSIKPTEAWCKPKANYSYTRLLNPIETCNKKNNIVGSLKAIDNLKSGNKIYKTNTYLITNNEKRFLNEFLKEKHSNFIINPQVRVADVIEPVKGLNPRLKRSALFQITSWHFDFVITDKNYKILFAIELDDASHDRKDRVRRDFILNQACKNAGLQLHRYRLHQGVFKKTYG